MITLQNVTWQAAVLGRWTARILGTLSVLFFLALVFGEGPPNPLKLSATENLSLVCMTALFLGLALAWYREGWGGALTLAAFAALGLISRHYLHIPAVQIPAAVGGLHLLCWLRLSARPPANPVQFSPPQAALIAAGAVTGLFLLLCANEIFGNPPLMTPLMRPGPTLAGTWKDADMVLAIHGDGSVTGSVTGTFYYNRSWFGKLMGWRSEYLIQGTESGRRFIAPLDLRGAELTGWHLHLRRIQ